MSMKKKKLLSLALSLVMAFSLAAPVMAADEEETPVTPYTVPADVKDKIVILHTNDTHGADMAVEGKTIGTAGVAALKADFEAAGAKVLLVNAGDSIMGKPLVSADKGKSAIEFMNAAGYDAMTVGNHEMDFGYDNLKELAKLAEFPILGADILDAKTNKPVFEANKIFDLGGVKVGVFGLATPETLTKADASKMEGITFPEKEELYKCAQAQVDALKKDGADLIVCLGHLGIADESAGNQSIDLCENVNGIDLFVDGHSHSTTEEVTAAVAKAEAGETNVVNGTKIVSTGTALVNVGVVVYDKDAKTLTDSLVPAAEYTKVDEAVAKMISDRNDEVNKMYGEKIAVTEVDLNGSRSGGDSTATNTKTVVNFPDGIGNRTAETNLGDFAADAILWQARKTLGEDKVDMALTNGGGIRETIAKGDISKLDLLAVFPFGNTVATIDVTGAQLLEALEAATSTTPDAIGAFPQVSGIEFVINTSNSYDQGEQYPASTYFAPKTINRVEILTVGENAFDPEATYTIATNDFTAKGGDTFGVFKAVGGWKDVGVSLDDALINYTTEVLKGTITAEQYGEAAGRITIVNRPADLDANEWYYAAAIQVLDNGYLKGTDKGFDAAANVTVATVYQTLYNIEGKPAAAEDAKTVTMPEGAWYADAINWAFNAGLYTAESFDADAVITRSALATIVANYCQSKDLAVEGGMAVKEAPDYDQVPEADVAGVGYCFEAGIMTGNEAGALVPAGQLTRAEWAQVLVNLEAFTTESAPAKAA